MIGFIIVRHVNSPTTNLYWQECYRCIRKWYTNKIIIIDDNSNKEFLTELEMDSNVEVIQSEFPGRAELLPYYYFLKYNWFDTAVTLHDSVFIQKPIKFNKENRFLWHFDTHQHDNDYDETRMIKQLTNHKGVLEFYYHKGNWSGCFGVMSVISYHALNIINCKYNFFKLLEIITCRKDRMCLERIFAAILSYEYGLNKNTCSYFGTIHAYCSWGYKEEYTYENYQNDKKNPGYRYPIIKLWSGR